jgi:hypothetical protein
MLGQYDWGDFILSEPILDAAEFSPVESAVCIHNMLHCIPRKQCYDVIDG